MHIHAMRHALFSSLLLLLTACGGGGESSSTSAPAPTNKAPVINASNVETTSKSIIELSAQATDSDGSITSYQWSQKSGTSINLSNTAGETLSFEVPDVDEVQIVVFTLTVTDDKSVSTTKDIEVMIEPEGFTFTISGIVTTSTQPLANLSVTASIGNQEYSTQTNAEGEYTLELANISYRNKDALLMLSATGSGTKSAIKLVSYVDDINSLNELAVENHNTISQNEHHSLIISSLSTSAAALMVRRNGQEKLISQQQLMNYSDDLESQIFLKYAELIDLTIENIVTSSTVPSSMKASNSDNLYDFIKIKENGARLLYEMEPVHPDVYTSNSFLEQIRNNKALLPPSLSFNNDSALSIYSSLGVITLNEDATGEIINTDFGKQDISWKINNKRLIVTLTEPKYLFKAAHHTEEYGNIETKLYETGYRIDFIWNNGYNHYQANAFKTHIYRSVEHDELVTVQTSLSLSPDNYIGLFIDNTLDMSSKITPSHQYLIAFTDASDIYSLNSNTLNISITSASQASFTFKKTRGHDANGAFNINAETHTAIWHISSSGELELTNDNWHIKILGLSENDGQLSNALVVARYQDTQTDTYTTKISKMYDITDPAPSWDNENVTGIYQYNGIWKEISPLHSSWYEFREDGTLSLFSLRTDDGVISANDIKESPGLWRIENGALIIRRYWYPYNSENSRTYCHSEIWDTDENSPCIAYLQREWQSRGTLLKDGNIYYTIERHVYLLGISSQEVFPSTVHLGEFIKLEDSPVTLPSDYVLIKDR